MIKLKIGPNFIKMINFYLSDFKYNPNYRSYLVDILKPLFPDRKLEKYSLTDFPFNLVDKISQSDFFLLPLCWNYYIEREQTHLVLDLIQTAQNYNKKILIFVLGDYYYKLPESTNIIGLYTSPYQSRQNVKTIPLPVIIQDPLPKLDKRRISLSNYNAQPMIGFCGQADPNLLVSSIKMIKLIYQNMSYSLHRSKKYSGPIIPPTYLRNKILNIIENSHSIKSDFIRRDRYQGGKSKNAESFEVLKREFYQNISHTDYTLCIRGTGNFSARFYETLAFGRIPIFINTDCILPFNKLIDWRKHIVWVEKNDISKIILKILDFHNGLTQDSFNRIQMSNRKLWEDYFSFSGFTHHLVPNLKEKFN